MRIRSIVCESKEDEEEEESKTRISYKKEGRKGSKRRMGEKKKIRGKMCKTR